MVRGHFVELGNCELSFFIIVGMVAIVLSFVLVSITSVLSRFVTCGLYPLRAASLSAHRSIGFLFSFQMAGSILLIIWPGYVRGFLLAMAVRLHSLKLGI